MNDWMNEAARLARKRAPQITPARALEVADDLYKAWHEEWTPAKAVGWFFAFMPLGWPTAEAEVHRSIAVGSSVLDLVS